MVREIQTSASRIVSLSLSLSVFVFLVFSLFAFSNFKRYDFPENPKQVNEFLNFILNLLITVSQASIFARNSIEPQTKTFYNCLQLRKNSLIKNTFILEAGMKRKYSEFFFVCSLSQSFFFFSKISLVSLNLLFSFNNVTYCFKETYF